MNMYKLIVFSWLPQILNAYRGELETTYTCCIILARATLSQIICVNIIRLGKCTFKQDMMFTRSRS